MKGKYLLLLCTLFACTSNQLLGQKNNEVNFSIGGTFTSDQTTINAVPTVCPGGCNVFGSHSVTDLGLAYEATYARRLVNLGGASIYAELPVLGVPGRHVTTSFMSGGFPVNLVTSSASAVFLTPSAKLKLFSSARISPFVSLGGGLAHVSDVSSHNLGALQYGGGADFKTPVSPLGLRFEVRDFYSGSGIHSSSFTTVSSSSFNTVSPERLHHIFIGGGVVLHLGRKAY